MKKQATVLSDDPKQPRLTLTVSGYVEKFATISPKVVRLVGPVGRPIKRSIMIIPEKKYRFAISGVEAQKGDNIRFELSETKNPEGSGYVLTIENLKKKKGRYFDVITLNTDSRIQPKIKLSVYGNILENRPKGARHRNPNPNKSGSK
jgi:hypothetical protein